MKTFAITGIGTDVGKTVVSAILVEALKASYWKPVQAGDLLHSDSIKIRTLCPEANILNEIYSLTKPLSPHAAAKIDGISIDMVDFALPALREHLIIEGAGGVMVPLNDNGLTYLDVFEQWRVPVVIVSRHYLGSINHSLLSIETLKNKGIEIAGVIFVGDENKATEEVILNNGEVKMLGRIPWVETIDRNFIVDQAGKLDKSNFEN